MLKLLSIAVLAVSFNLAPIAKADDSANKPLVKQEKVEKKGDQKKSETSCEHCSKNKHQDKDCACDGKADCKCEKKDCDTGECKKKDSKKFCKHCADHKSHQEEHKH